jgi:hypothetical protein
MKAVDRKKNSLNYYLIGLFVLLELNLLQLSESDRYAVGRRIERTNSLVGQFFFEGSHQ